MSFRLLSYRANPADEPRTGLLRDDSVIDVADAFGTACSTLSLLQDWEASAPRLEELAAGGKAGRPLAELVLAAPILYPANIFCAAANYQDHFREMSGRDVDKSKIKPYFFSKISP